MHDSGERASAPNHWREQSGQSIARACIRRVLGDGLATGVAAALIAACLGSPPRKWKRLPCTVVTNG